MGKKHVGYEIGLCSVCGSDNVEHSNQEIDGDNVGYDIRCLDCEAYGKEWYQLVYHETIMFEKETLSCWGCGKDYLNFHNGDCLVSIIIPEEDGSKNAHLVCPDCLFELPIHIQETAGM